MVDLNNNVDQFITRVARVYGDYYYIKNGNELIYSWLVVDLPL
jgi:hypothetical protein